MGGFNQGADRARILVADNVELFRRGLREELASGGRFVVAAEAARLEDVPGIYARVRPDVALISVSESDEAGRKALRDVLWIDQRARIIVLIAPEASEQVVQFIQAGAQGVLLRDASTATILGALRDVYEGGCALDGRLANLLFQGLAGSPAPVAAGVADGLNPAVLSLLSQREREVLQALALGFRNKQIGAELGVSVGTVKTHLRHIFRKLHVQDRTAAVLKALDGRLRKAA